MKRFFVCQDNFGNGIIEGEEYNHMKNVMRMHEGDRFVAITNDDNDYLCEIVSLNKNNGTFKVIESQPNTSNPNLEICLIQALAKGDKLDLITQKATELGASTIIPLYTKNCDVKQNTGKIDRLERITLSACKQCGRSKMVKITDCVKLSDLEGLLVGYDAIYVAYEKEKQNSFHSSLMSLESPKKIAVIIGPEGGFEPEEIEKIENMGGKAVTFGKRILRTETAGLYALSVITELLGN